MARSRSKAKKEADLAEKPDESQQLPPKVRKSRNEHDPRESLSVGVVAGELTTDGPRESQSRRGVASLYTRYARSLIANEGDVIAALSDVYDISRDEALKNCVELHEKIVGASRATASVSDMIEAHDITAEVRLAKLRELVFSPDARIALGAIDRINDMDASSKTRRIGTTWESFVRRARDKANKQLALKK